MLLIKPFITLLSLMIFSASISYAENYKLEGKITDQETGEIVQFANVYIQETQEGTTTDEDGYFSLSLPEGTYTLRVTYLGYEPLNIDIELNQDLFIEESIVPRGYDVEEVEIEARRTDRRVESTEMGRVELQTDAIESLPVVFGELDIMKTLQLTPGVQNTSEGSSGLNVRGGGTDQNLILMDGAPVYNVSHLLGFFSIFHADAVESFSLTKGGMPARYGGRLSSVLDVNLREGNEEAYRVRGGLGIISSRIMAEGPIRKGQGGFMIGGRRTYIDALVQPFLDDDIRGNRYFFYDLTGKAHYRIDARNTISLSGYMGRDIFRYDDDGGFIPIDLETDWGNTVFSLNWARTVNTDLYSTYTLYYSDYDFSFNVGQDVFDFRLLSDVRDIGAEARFSYYPADDHEVRFGAELVNHRVDPGLGQFSVEDESEEELDLPGRRANYLSLYAEDEWSISERLKLNYGLRYSLFNHIGPYEMLQRDNQGFIEDTASFDDWESITFYDGWEPRISGRYLINDNLSAKLAYTRNYQFIHLASVTGGTLPTDIWVPSSELIKPQYADQVATGAFYEWDELGLEFSFETYYKWMYNQIDFRPGAQLILNPFLDEEFLQGSGEAYGTEFMVEKKAGNFTGWIAYTWSNTSRTIEGINDGNPYSPSFDITHDLSLVLNYEINQNWDASLVFVYATGRPFTPETGHMLGNFGFPDQMSGMPSFQSYPLFAEEKNSFRTEDYHRADISLNYRPGGQDRRFQSYWNFSVYNIYNRKNPYFYDFQFDPETGEGKVDKIYIFPVLPSVTYNFRF